MVSPIDELKFLSRDHLGLGIALTSTIAALGIHLMFEKGGGVWALTMIPMAVLPTWSANRLSSTMGVGAAVIVDVFLLPPESISDSFVNVCLLVSAGALSFKACRQHLGALLQSPVIPLSPAGRALDAIFGMSPIVALDERGSVVSMTAPALRMFGLNSTIAIGRPFSELVDHFVPSPPPRPRGSVATTQCRWLGRRNDGHPFLLDIASTIAKRDGAVLSILHLSRVEQPQDIADASPGGAEQSYRIWRLNSLGLMAATLAHELSQPLTAAANYVQAAEADMVRAGPLGDSANRTLDLAKQQILRAGRIIGKLHDLLAPNSGSRRHERMGALIKDLDPILGPLCREAGVLLRIRIDANNDTVLVEGSQIQQVIVNLVRNAVQAASGVSEPEVRISGRPRPAGLYEILIEDSGPGFSPEAMTANVRPRIGLAAGSLGLGLALARSLVEQQGGVLSMGRSEDLGGAAVRFTLTRIAMEGLSG